MINNIYKDYICPFCNDFFNCPRECANCHQNYCKLCIEKIKFMDCKCPKCDKSIKQNTFENKYLISSLEKIKFFCPDCGKTYQKYKDFSEHIKTPHNNNFKCKFCFFDTNNEKNFIEHLLQYHKLDLLSIMNSNSFLNKNLENNALNNNNNNKPLTSNIIENNMSLSLSFHLGNSNDTYFGKMDFDFPHDPPNRNSLDQLISSTVISSEGSQQQSLTQNISTKMNTEN